MSSSRLLARIGSEDRQAIDGVLYHHERCDGSGYPVGMGRESIPMLAQCVGLADVYSRMLVQRPDEPAISLYDALASVSDGAFDAGFVGRLVELAEQDSATTAAAEMAAAAAET